jgi:osmotically-inducible protein OsmY
LALVLLLLLAPAGGVFLLSALTAAEESKASPHPQDSTPSVHDLEVTIRAREALARDDTLAPLNLGVKVRKGVATLCGPVPSGEMIRRAAEVLEKVRGIYEVRSELYVAAALPSPADLPSTDPGRFDTLTGLKPEAPRTHVTLMGPVAADGPATKPDAPPAGKIAPPSAESVTQAVDRLRQSELRFQSIRTEVRDGTVIVRGGTVRGEYVTAFAQAVSRLPGVERVMVDSKR